MNIDKTDLVSTLAQKNKVYKEYMVKDIAGDIFDEIANALRNRDRTSTYKLGTFDVEKYKSRPALRPATKKSVAVSEFQNAASRSRAGLLRGIREWL